MRARFFAFLATVMVLGAGCPGSQPALNSWEVWDQQGVLDDSVMQIGDSGDRGGLIDTSIGSPWEGTGAKAVVALSSVESCEELVQRWKDEAIENLRKEMEQALNYVLQWRKDCYYGEWVLMDAVPYDPGSGAYDSGGGASEYSTTNVQVVGVDEADWLKNDGSWMYILADQKLQIVDAWPPEQAHIVSRTPIEGRPIAMFVHEDRAVVFSSLNSQWYSDYNRSTCTYGYDCEFTGDGGDTLITVFDLTDRSKPQKVREVWINGSYLTSRRIEKIVYPVVHFREPGLLTYGWSWSYPDIVAQAMDRAQCGEPINLDPAVVKEAFEELFEQKKAEILNSDFTQWLPSVRDIVYKDGVPTEQANPLTNCEDAYVDEMHDGMALLSVLSFDMTKEETLTATSVLSRPGAVFASRQSLYLATRHRKTFGEVW